MKPTQWKVPNRAEQQYRSDILQVMLEFFSNTPDILGSITGRLISFSEFLDRYADQAARKMVTGRLVEGQRTWRSAARESMQGQLLYRALQNEMQGPVGARYRQLIAQNAELIRTLPRLIVAKTTAMIATRQQEGSRAEISVPELLRHVTRVEAARIARTETSKASTALTQARSESLNLNFYVWRTSEDARVRLSHRKMAGVVVAWTDPPDPERLAGEKSSAGHYNAGNVWNCRCYPETLLSLNQIGWPHRVFHGGRITVMTLSAFRAVSNLPQPLAA